MNTLHKFRKYCFCIACSFLVFSCDEFVKIDAPRTDLVRATVFVSDATAEAAMIDIYFGLKAGGFASGNPSSISLFGSISSDEMISHARNTVEEYRQFNDNALQPNNILLSNLWSGIYIIIYKTNAIIEGLSTSSGVSENLKNQLIGEAKFVRSLCHFCLVNLWGDVPLIVTTDYKTNNSILRTDKAQVYKQIITDLKDAQGLLTNDYSFSNNQRIRANAGAATALLARVYLYNEDWASAEAEATTVINNTAQYNLESNLSSVFRTTSREAILQMWSEIYPKEFSTFFVHPVVGPLFGVLRPELVNNFEAGDQRSIAWVKNVSYGGNSYYQPIKYKSFAIPPDDFSTVLRLAEQYLIRAEARAQLGKFLEAASEFLSLRPI